jgi:hypothetical protein
MARTARCRLAAKLLSVLALTACQKESPKPTSQAAAPSAAAPSTAARVTADTTLGFDSVATRKLPDGKCFVGTRYVVVARDHEVGSDFFVRPRGDVNAEARCTADSVPGDLVFRTGEAAGLHPDAQYFLGLKTDLLLAGDGTGGRTDLYVYDLKKGAKVLEVDGIDDSELRWPAPMTLSMWVTQAYGKMAAAAGCPDTMPANPALLDSLMSLELGPLTLRSEGRFRCKVGQ